MKLLKILKQEMLFIPIMLLFIEGLRATLVHFSPDTAVFDRASELETFVFRAWQMVWITSLAWVLLRVVFPGAYQAMKRFYSGYKDLPEPDQRNWALRIFFAFFFGMVFLLSGKASTEPPMRLKLMDTLHSQLYVREATGNNDGVEVEKYLEFVGRQKGDAWCAAFASWNLNAIGVSTPPNPKSGWSPNFANKKYVVWSQELVKQHKAKKPQKGDCFTLYYSNLGRVGHVGFVVDETDNYFITIEGNTGLTGSREGSGVHKYKRAKNKVHAVTDYITPYLKKHEKDIRIAHSNNLPSFLPYKTDTINRYKQVGNQHNNIGLIPRFYFGSRFSCYTEGRQCFNSCTDRTGYKRSYSTNNCIDEFDPGGIGCVNPGWQTLCKMQMQRYRIKLADQGAFYKEIPFKKLHQYAYTAKNYSQNNREKLYTKMAYTS